jgi:Rha family phage regulatory protein
MIEQSTNATALGTTTVGINYTAPLMALAAIVHLHRGEAVTDSLVIAREFGRKHGNVLQSLDDLKGDGTISRHDFKPSHYFDKRGKVQRKIELTERGALIAMPFIGGKSSRAGQQRLVDAFLNVRAELAAQSESWSDARRSAASAYIEMCAALKEVRADAGKTTEPRHYMTEAKLVNGVLFGHFRRVNVDLLSQSEINLKNQIERRNAFLIARGRTYIERKAMLPGFLSGLLAKRVAAPH